MVGRTVVNFQRLEHNLKLAARLGPLKGNLHKVQKDISTRRERSATLTLGQAIQAWIVNFDATPTQSVEIADLFDVSIESTLTLGLDADGRDRYAEALRNLLTVRNELIHSRLATFDWDSAHACDSLVAELDRVNAAISEQIEQTHSLLNSIAELYREHAESMMDTPEPEAPQKAT